jgi:hypothetical protein
MIKLELIEKQLKIDKILLIKILNKPIAIEKLLKLPYMNFARAQLKTKIHCYQKPQTLESILLGYGRI